MKTGNCPSCGAPIEFAPGAGKVKVCAHCSTVVLYGDAKLSKVGKVAELVDTDSPLSLGLSGKHTGAGFTVVGRIQKTHDTQTVFGTWDEWFLSFDDGRSGWLSQSEGQWNLMFPLVDQRPPTFADANPGTDFQLKGTRFVVEERGKARTVSAQGQLPDLHPDHPFVDATGPKGVFVSIDYGEGEPGEAFVGSTVRLDALGFDKSELSSTPRRAALSQARCTQCNGMLELKAPDLAKRVACPFCGALLDCSGGTLSFLELLQKPNIAPTIPLGSKGFLQKIQWTCIAFLVRSCTVESVRYEWNEYLLYEKAHGFRWLMEANGHWTFLTPVSAGEVLVSFKHAVHANQSYTLFQTVNTTTDYVLGECYWAVSQGEHGWAAEYIAPPSSLNLDRTESEVSFTVGTLLSTAEVREAFKLSTLDVATGIAPAQLNPWKERASSGWKWGGLWSAAIVGLFIVFSAMSPSGTFLKQSFPIPPTAAPGSPEAMTFSEPFNIPAKTPLEVKVETTGLSNQWVSLQTDLINQETFEVISLDFETSDYHGVDDGESWSEGSLSHRKSTAEVDPGSYVMRVTPAFEPANRPQQPLLVEVTADGPGLCCPLMLVLLILSFPVFASVRSSAFESTRWNDSVMQPVDFSGNPDLSSSRSDDDDSDDSGSDDD